MPHVQRCANCPYRGRAIGTIGRPESPIVLCGEAPGANELIQGRPFIGASGKLLWDVMNKLGLPNVEGNCYITNALQCRPPQNEPPSKEAVAACHVRLMAEISSHPRKVVITMGNTSTHSVLGKKTPITQARGRPSRLADGTLVVPTWHPAAILRNRGIHGPMYKQFKADLDLALRMAKGEVISDPGETIAEVVNDADRLDFYVTELQKVAVLAADIETGGLNPRTDPITCLGIAYAKNRVVIFPQSYIYNGGPNGLERLFNNPHIRWVWHNGKFDASFLRQAGLNARVDEDTMLLHYCLDENKGTHGLKERAHADLGSGDYDGEVKKKAKNAKKRGFADVDPALLYPYLAKDADYTLQLYNLYKPQVDGDDSLKWLKENLIMPASHFLQQVEEDGIYVDREALETLRSELIPVRDAAAVKAFECIRELWDAESYTSAMKAKKEPKAFNINSRLHIEWLLYHQLGIPLPKGQEKRKTRKETLVMLRDKTGFIAQVLKYRDVAKTLSTYVDGVSDRIGTDGRIHATYLVHGTETGRLSSSGPNMQNIPRDRRIKNIFAAPPGRRLIECDYAAAELRVLALMSRDPWMVQVYQENRDLHNEMAAAIYGDGYTKDQRDYAKRLNFGIVYGMTAKLLSSMINCTEAEATRMILAWFARVPMAKRFLDLCRTRAAKGKYLETPFGRRRRFPEFIPEEALHGVQNEACNFPIQSIASDLTLISGIQLYRVLPEYDSVITNIVHDALIIETPDDDRIVEAVVRLVRNKMKEVPRVELGDLVPFESEAKVGTNWGELKKYLLPEDRLEKAS